jgi:barstar (barnase inhibitor)
MDQARKAMAKIYVLPNVPITGRAAFFDAVRGIFPLDPPVLGSRMWDALSDSLAGGLAGVDTAYVVIIWPSANAMKAASPDEYERALLLWRDVAAELKDPSRTFGRRMLRCTWRVKGDVVSWARQRLRRLWG